MTTTTTVRILVVIVNNHSNNSDNRLYSIDMKKGPGCIVQAHLQPAWQQGLACNRRSGASLAHTGPSPQHPLQTPRRC